jgi:ubiquinone/menaquinone biosynthesis C-methylase UbiE
MATSTQGAQPSPVHFFETAIAFQRSAALQAAVELDIFTAIGEGAATPRAIAQRCGAAERGARILCDYLTVIGFLLKQDGSYRLTQDSAVFLDRRSPGYLGSAVRFLTSPALTGGFTDLAAAVRKGGTVMDGGTVAPEHPIWAEFARSMAPMMALPAEKIADLLEAENAGPRKVLDLAAGHGLFGIALARRNPQARVVALDWAEVLEVARENAIAAGVADRHEGLAGNAFDVEFGAGYDLVLLTNFLHHFDPPTCEQLLRKVRAALKPGGRAVTLEFVPNEDRVSPPIAAAFSLMMLGTTPEGDAYPFPELERMFRNAGFAESRLHAIPPSEQQVVISVR